METYSIFSVKGITQALSLAPQLFSKHLVKQGYSDMRVNLAAKVFSATSAAGIYTNSTLGLLPQEAMHAA